MVPNIEMEDIPVIKVKANEYKRKTQAFDGHSNESNPQLEFESVSESENSEDDIVDIRRPEYVEHRLQQQMFLDRKNRFQHIICTVVKDKISGKYQSFSRGEAIAIFTNCTDFWNGKSVVPIT